MKHMDGDGDGSRATGPARAAAAPGAAGLDPLEVANRLRPVVLRLSRHLRREAHAVGLTGGRVHILATVRDHPGIGVVDLAASEEMSAPSMSNHIDRLEAAGMVVRTRATGAEVDRRRVGLTITPDGRRALTAVRTRRTAWLAERLRGLDAADIASIDASVGALGRLPGPVPTERR